MSTGGWWEALWPDPAGVLAAVGIKPGMEVIDLCSGDGWFTCAIADIARHVPRHRLAKTELANCDFVAGSGPGEGPWTYGFHVIIQCIFVLEPLRRSLGIDAVLRYRHRLPAHLGDRTHG